jgi:hypothetical protein
MTIPAAQAYLFSAPAGVAGDITRTDESNVEPAQLVAAGGVYPSAFGVPMKYVSGGIQQFNGGAETAASFAGVLIREAPGISGALADDTAAPPAGGSPWANNVPVGLLVRGYCTVVVAAGTPARGGVVYVQIVANGGVAVGSFRADGTDSGNAVALTAAQAEWASDGKDSNNIAELRVAR